MNTIKQLHPGDEAALERFLLTHLDSSMFLLSNLRKAGLMDKGERYSGTYVAAFQNGEIVGIVAHYWNGNLLCQAPTHLDSLWRQAINTSGRALAGIIGPGDQVKALCHSLDITPQQCRITGDEGLFTLSLADLILPGSLRDGAVIGRHMTTDDIDQLSAWRAAYNHETLGAPETPAGHDQARSEMERAYQEASTWVLYVDDRPVAMTSFNATLAEAVQIGGVYTPPELRRRGYARAVVAASLRDAKAVGVQRAILFTDDDNIHAQKAYRALGFVRAADWGLVLLKEPIVTAIPASQVK